MAKVIHTMIRVLDLDKSMKFYADVLGLTESHRLDFPDFALVYLRNAENDVEIELTLNKGRTEPYTHGTDNQHHNLVIKNTTPTHTALGMARSASWSTTHRPRTPRSWPRATSRRR